MTAPSYTLQGDTKALSNIIPHSQHKLKQKLSKQERDGGQSVVPVFICTAPQASVIKHWLHRAYVVLIH